MSIELSVFAPEPLTRTVELENVLSGTGWVCRFLSDEKDPIPVDISRASLALGLPTASAGKLDDGVWNQDSIQGLSRNERIASAGLSVVSVGPIQRQTLTDVAKEAPRRFRSRIQSAHVIYTVATSATRNDPSLGFQRALWLAIAFATRGIAHDEENGEFHDVSAP
jgi:hypothetical protein